MNGALVVEPAAPAGPVVLEAVPAVVVLEREQLVLLRDSAPVPHVACADAPMAPVVVEPPVRPQVVAAGFPGPRGPQGPKGDPGGGTATYTHTQAVPAAQWTINHNLGFQPAVALLTAGGAVIDAEVAHTSANTAIVTLTQPLAGTARCN